MRTGAADSNICIIVNPRLLAVEMRARLARDRRVMLFDDFDALERWRSRCVSTGGVACEVAAVLGEIGCEWGRLPHDLARAIERLTLMSVTPKVGEFARNGHAERTFYRRWNRILPVRPKEFLDRVRFLHALRLIEQLEYSVKEAAALAGYGSSSAFRAAAKRNR